jgi:hypothetical protein
LYQETPGNRAVQLSETKGKKLTSWVCVIVSHVAKVEGHHDDRESFCGNRLLSDIPDADQPVGIEVEYLRLDVAKSEREVVSRGIEFERRVGWEGEVGRESGEFGRYGLVEGTTSSDKTILLVEGETWNARDGEREDKANPM